MSILLKEDRKWANVLYRNSSLNLSIFFRSN